jgi:endonuclease I
MSLRKTGCLIALASLTLFFSCAPKISSLSLPSSPEASSGKASESVADSSFSSSESPSPVSSLPSSAPSSVSSVSWALPSSLSSSAASYYQGIDFSLSGAELKTALSKKILTHTSLGYSNVGESVFEKTDNKDGKVWDMYSNQSFSFSESGGNYKKEGDCWNKEHTVPQSLFNEQEPMRSDLFHLYPTDGYVNNRRSNYPHAEVGSAVFTSSNGTKVGTSKTSGVSGNVCEPIDEYKGDFARSYFYMVTCYQSRVTNWVTFAAFAKNTYPSLSSWAITLYEKWSAEDPVSQKEIDRNEAVYGLQKNRNPFIDYPGIETKIW